MRMDEPIRRGLSPYSNKNDCPMQKMKNPTAIACRPANHR